MARSTQQILSQIKQQVTANIPQLNSPSDTAIYNLWEFISANSQNTFEVDLDNYLSQINAVANSTPAGTTQWIASKIKQFQYSLTNPQILQFDTNSLTFYYPTITPYLQIISQVSVTVINNTISIKVAKTVNNILTQLTNDELSALVAYASIVLFAGINYSVVSLPNAILGFVPATSGQTKAGLVVYYDSQFTNITIAYIQQQINLFLQSIAFNGVFYFSKFLSFMTAIDGVIDIEVFDIYSADGTGSVKNYIIANSLEIPGNLAIQSAPGYWVVSTDSTSLITLVPITNTGYSVSNPNLTR